MEDGHIAKISDAYDKFSNIEGFSKIITKEEVIQNDGALTISLYLPESNSAEIPSVEDALETWVEISKKTMREYDKLTNMIGGK